VLISQLPLSRSLAFGQEGRLPFEHLLWSMDVENEESRFGECAQLLVDHLPAGFKLVSEGFALVSSMALPAVLSSVLVRAEL
jgi:hypothetical protein